MNDTNAVVAEGLFPVEGGNSLALVYERVDYTLIPGGIRVKRHYLIENTAQSPRNSILGSICLLPEIDVRGRVAEIHEDAYADTEVTIDGTTAEFTRKIGRLVDEGGHIRFDARTLAEIAKCEITNDGDICGHAWFSFPVVFDAKQRRTVEITYTVEDRSPRFLTSTLSWIQLYTEKFWENEAVPLIEVTFGLEGAVLAEDVFKPQGRLAKYSQAPTAFRNGTFVWRIENYEPSKTPYSYTTRLVHYGSVDMGAIESAYHKISSARPGEKAR